MRPNAMDQQTPATAARSRRNSTSSGSSPRVSVVICTLAPRHHYLVLNFEQLLKATGVESEEVVVVAEDANYLDRVMREFGDRLPLTCAKSETPGLSDKRNVGAQVARGDVVAYLDDDAMATQDYFVAIGGVFDDGALCVAGAVEPVFEAEIPPQLRESAFRIGGFNRWNGVELPDRWAGANCLFRRDVLLAAGPFDTRFGPHGALLPWGDDAEMFRRMDARHGMRFAPEITVRHHIQPERLTSRYVRTRIFKTGRTLCVIDRLHRPDFWRRTRSIPLMWGIAFIRVLSDRFSFSSRLRLRHLSGYLYQAVLLALRGVPPKEKDDADRECPAHE